MTYTIRHRKEFTKQTKREALKRSGGLCEGEGPLYGLPQGQRCGLLLSYGIHFDHVNPDSNGGEPTLENCAATCPKCNLYKADKFDKARAAKGVRQRDKHNGIRGVKKPWPSRKMNPPKFDNTRFIERY